MGIIEEATRRLEQLERAGVGVPWSAARLHPRSGPQAAVRPRKEETFDLPANDAKQPDEDGLALHPSARRDPSHNLTIDLDRLFELGCLVPGRARAQVVSEFRELKRAILRNARPQDGPSPARAALIVVTSAIPGEGKTFCAINLAMSMAMEVDTSVLLVDADVVQPSVLARLNARTEPRPGLLDLLTDDKLALHDVLLSTNVPKLTVMGSGARNERSAELLGSKAMDRLLDRLAADYADHIVVFDAPPLLMAAEASILAGTVGQVVMVVEASRTPRDLVGKAYASLRTCPTVLSVLNKCDEAKVESQYGEYGQHGG